LEGQAELHALIAKRLDGET
jgi:hypothetical protein